MRYNSNELKNGIVILIEEGKGNYKGRSRNPSYNPKGRCGAKVTACKDGKIVYTSFNASTLPDSLSTWYTKNLNDGTPIPTLCEGIYPLYGKMHLGKHKAMELGYGNEKNPVIRNSEMSTSTAINFHYRHLNDPSASSMYASSVGCITMLEADLFNMFVTLGVNEFNGNYIGKLIVDRGGLYNNKKLYDNYKRYYKDNINKFATDGNSQTLIEPKLIEPKVDKTLELNDSLDVLKDDVLRAVGDYMDKINGYVKRR